MSVEETTSTPFSATPQPFLTGRHRVPFHRRISELSGKPTDPTAQTSLAAARSTADRVLGRLDPPGLGLGTIFHAEPFHRSTSVVLLREAKSSAYPTAQTSVEETASASSRVKKSAPDHVGFGV